MAQKVLSPSQKLSIVSGSPPFVEVPHVRFRFLEVTIRCMASRHPRTFLTVGAWYCYCWFAVCVLAGSVEHVLAFIAAAGWSTVAYLLAHATEYEYIGSWCGRYGDALLRASSLKVRSRTPRSLIRPFVSLRPRADGGFAAGLFKACALMTCVVCFSNNLAVSASQFFLVDGTECGFVGDVDSGSNHQKQ